MLYEIQPTGPARRLATQQVGYDQKKISCAATHNIISLMAPHEFNVVLRTTTDESYLGIQLVILRTFLVAQPIHKLFVLFSDSLSRHLSTDVSSILFNFNFSFHGPYLKNMLTRQCLIFPCTKLLPSFGQVYFQFLFVFCCWICRSRCPTCDLRPLPVKTINISHIKASRLEWPASIHSRATAPTRRLSVRIATIYQTSEVCAVHPTDRTFETGIRSADQDWRSKNRLVQTFYCIYLDFYLYLNFFYLM